MGLHVQSLLSGSSGNSAAVWSDDTVLLIDAGISSQRRCRELLAVLPALPSAAFISHAHGDHACPAALLVLARAGVPVYARPEVCRFLAQRCDSSDEPLELRMFDRGLRVGDLQIDTFSLPHAPGYANSGFVVSTAAEPGRRALFATDFCDPHALAGRLDDASFAFVESNYDAHLLRRNPNPASRYHMRNEQPAGLLARASASAGGGPRRVVLAHLSVERNTPELAESAVCRAFGELFGRPEFELTCAPRCEPSPVWEVA